MDGGVPAELVTILARAMGVEVVVVRVTASGLKWYAETELNIEGGDGGDGKTRERLDTPAIGGRLRRWAVLTAEGVDHCRLVGTAQTALAVEALRRVKPPGWNGQGPQTIRSGRVRDAWPVGAVVGADGEIGATCGALVGPKLPRRRRVGTPGKRPNHIDGAEDPPIS